MWSKVFAISLMVADAAGFITLTPMSASGNYRNSHALSRPSLRAASTRTNIRPLSLRMGETKTASPLRETAKVEEVALQETESRLAPASPTQAMRIMFSQWSTTMGKKQATWILLAIVAVSGFAFAATKYAATAFESSTILALRFAIASLCLIPWLKMDKKTFMAGIETSGWLGAGYATQILCMAGGTSAGVASFFASMSCVVCPFLEVLFAGIVLTTRSWVAAGLAVAGAGFLCLWDGLPKPADMIGLLQAFFFGMHLFRVEKALHANPGKAMEITAIQLLFITAGALGWIGLSSAAAVGVPPVTDWIPIALAWIAGLADKWPQFLAVAWLGVVPSAMALSLETVVVAQLSASRVALMFATEPLFAALLACTFLGEGLGINLIIGGTLAIAACLTRSKDTVWRKISEVMTAVSGSVAPKKLKEGPA